MSCTCRMMVTQIVSYWWADTETHDINTSMHVSYLFIVNSGALPMNPDLNIVNNNEKHAQSCLDEDHKYYDVAGSHAAWSHGRRTRDFLRRQAVNTRPGQILEIILLNTDNMRVRHNTHDVTWQQSHDLYRNDIETGNPGHFAYTGLDFGCVHNK